MSQLGTLLLVSGATGKYAAGGIAAGHTAAFSVTETAGAVALAIALFRLRRERSRARTPGSAPGSAVPVDDARDRHTA